MDDVLISNPEKLAEKIEKFKSGGVDSIHVLTDFDRTLTKAFRGKEKVSTLFAEIRNGHYLTPDYASRAHALFDKYHPIEIDGSIDKKDKDRAMQEWWRFHFDLLIECGLNKEVMRDIIQKRTIEPRSGVGYFFEQLKNKNIPAVIMSAAIGDMVLMYLEQERLLQNNIYVVANFFEFDENGVVTKIKKPIIHSLNKSEIALSDFPFYEKIKDRKNIILLGDGIDDIGMAEGFEYDEIISVGFLNENTNDNREPFQKNFDVVITGDGDMGYVNEMMGKILE